MLSSHCHRTQGIWFNPGHPMKMICPTSSTFLVHLPANVIKQHLVNTASRCMLKNCVEPSNGCLGMKSTTSSLKQNPFLKTDDDAPYFVVLVRPADDKRSKCDATIITHAVFHLLFRKHRKEFKREYRELFHLLSRNRKTTEADHDMLEEGIDVHGTIIALQ